MSETTRLQHRTWSKDHYMISTDPALIPVKKLNEAFASTDVYWALPMPEEVMQETLERSVCFGLHQTEGLPTHGESREHEAPRKELVGFARLITDSTTFVYLTDVYVWPSHQGTGLGKWLITCIQEVIGDMPYLRRSMLFTSDWERSVPFYRKLMGMELVGSKDREHGGLAVMQWKGRGFPLNL